MPKHEKNCRAIAAAIVALLTAAFLFFMHAKQHASKEQFLAYQARRYDLFIQHPSVLRDLQTGILGVGTTIIIYELLSKFLIKVLPRAPGEEDKGI
jgi:uncharacterized membrane protein YwzB